MYSVLVECSRIATRRGFCNIECFPDQANVRSDIEDTEKELSVVITGTSLHWPCALLLLEQP
jgi:hypothetical protein